MEPEKQKTDPLVGQILSDRYRIDALIGEGGMGRVYLAEHTLMRKRLAIKVLREELGGIEEVIERFQREAMAAANIEHPNVAAATDFGKTASGSLYLVMEFVEGVTLSQALDAGRFEVPRAVHVAEQMFRALVRAHGLGIIHRDLKPDNIHLVEREGDPDFVKVLDFGIAKVSMGDLGGKKGAPLTQVGLVYGTPEYMAPEQALGQPVDPRADLYAVGVMLYEMLAGRAPFIAEDKVQLLGMHIGIEPQPISETCPEAGVPKALDAYVLQLLAKRRDERPKDATMALARLEQAASGVVIEASSAKARRDEPVSVRLSAQEVAEGRPTGRLSRTFVRAATELVPVVAEGLRKVESRFGRFVTTLRTAYIRDPRRGRLVLGVSAGGLALAILVVAVAAGGDEEARSDLPPRPGVPVVATDRVQAQVEREIEEYKETPEVRAALAKLAQGRAPGAIQDLEALREREPENARAAYLLGTIYAKKERYRLALARYETALGLDARLRADETLRRDVLAALGSRRSGKKAAALLATHVGDAVADDLVTIAIKGETRLARRNARGALERMGTIEHLAPWAQRALALSTARGCAAKRALIVEIGEIGDPRASPVLRRLPRSGKRSGCGFLGLEACPAPCYVRELRAAQRKLGAAPEAEGD